MRFVVIMVVGLFVVGIKISLVCVLGIFGMRICVGWIVCLIVIVWGWRSVVWWFVGVFVYDFVIIICLILLIRWLVFGLFFGCCFIFVVNYEMNFNGKN